MLRSARGWGDEFAAELDKAMARIAAYPTVWSAFSDGSFSVFGRVPDQWRGGPCCRGLPPTPSPRLLAITIAVKRPGGRSIFTTVHDSRATLLV